MSALYSQSVALLAIAVVIIGAAVSGLWKHRAQSKANNEARPVILGEKFRASLLAARNSALQRKDEARRAKKFAGHVARRKKAREESL